MNPGTTSRSSLLRGRSRVRPYHLLLAPAAIYVAATTLYPVGHTVYLSFTNLRWDQREWTFVGISNYSYIFDAPHFWHSVRVTFIYVGLTLCLQLVLGLAVAMALTRPSPGTAFMRVVAVIPWILPGFVVAVFFRLIFSPTRIGLVNLLLERAGLSHQAWLVDPDIAMMLLVLTATWNGIGLVIVLLLAALQTVPAEFYEAAQVDGASRLRTLRSITLPLIWPTVLFAAILITAFSFNDVGIVFGLTGGGPGRATEVIAMSVYRQGFSFFEAGLASAISVVLLVVNLIVTGLYVRMRRDERPLE